MQPRTTSPEIIARDVSLEHDCTLILLWQDCNNVFSLEGAVWLRTLHGRYNMQEGLYCTVPDNMMDIMTTGI